MEETNTEWQNNELSTEDELKVSEGRKRFKANNDDDALDLAENLFRMNRQVLDVQNAVKLVEIHHHRRGRISRAANNNNNSGKEPVEAQAIIHSGAATTTYVEQPPFGYSLDGTKLPKLPPLKRLEGIIESCSRPFQKQLTRTDTSTTHDRLSFHKDDARWGIVPFLNSMNYGVRDLEKGIPVTTYDSRGKKYSMVFKTWTHNKVYLLNTVGWKEFVLGNNLENYYHWVSVWAFSRKPNRKLCFALIVKRFNTPYHIKKRSKRQPPFYDSD